MWAGDAVAVCRRATIGHQARQLQQRLQLLNTGPSSVGCAASPAWRTVALARNQSKVSQHRLCQSQATPQRLCAAARGGAHSSCRRGAAQLPLRQAGSAVGALRKDGLAARQRCRAVALGAGPCHAGTAGAGFLVVREAGCEEARSLQGACLTWRCAAADAAQGLAGERVQAGELVRQAGCKVCTHAWHLGRKAAALRYLLQLPPDRRHLRGAAFRGGQAMQQAQRRAGQAAANRRQLQHAVDSSRVAGVFCQQLPRSHRVLQARQASGEYS